MSVDVCVCGHLEQTHGTVLDPGHGDCRMPTCACADFVSEDDVVEEAD